ncbi:hypothetical protein PSHT_06911 [Puccinia striiformis]|uniref:Uncharacterized protein n=1 Tax=Puccinia striiformis TaxID=27350 RepID=A0A2S4W2I3_9BASI|nr:hypothetical protein PSHT_06911 [Puccinia striiformis]
MLHRKESPSKILLVKSFKKATVCQVARQPTMRTINLMTPTHCPVELHLLTLRTQQHSKVVSTLRQPMNSAASSYRFSPRRIFPRHQISLGAGMRDLYQDREIEANEREGEAQAHRMIEMIGEDDTMPSQRPSPGPELSPTPHGEDGLKRSSSKVKHSLKKLKIAFKKITPNLSSASSATSSPPTNTPSKRKSYSTAFGSKGRVDNLGSPMTTTVSRAASRTLPGPTLGGSSQTLRRFTSHYPPSSIPTEVQPDPNGKTRSTSLDHDRSTELAAALGALKLKNTDSNLFTIHQSAATPAESPSPRQGSLRPSIVKSDKEDSTRLSSPSTSHFRSDRTSATSRSPARSDVDDEASGQLSKGTESRFNELNSIKVEAISDSHERISIQGPTSSPTEMTPEGTGSPDARSSVNSHTPISRSRTSLLGPEERTSITDVSSNNSTTMTLNQPSSSSMTQSQTQTSTTPSQADR